MRNMALVSMMLLVTVPAFAGQLSSKPYKQLFDPQASAKEALRQAPAQGKVPPRPKLVCGMVIVPADPNVDPKMAKTPQQSGVEYKIRVIEPPICKAGQ